MIFMLSDAHFGIYPSKGEKWLKTMSDYFDEFFIPLLRKYSKEGDRLVFLGDLFDNRNSINVKVLNRVVCLFEEIAGIISIEVLIGNHDMWAMMDTHINAVVSIKNIPGVTIHDTPTLLEVAGTKMLMCPWIEGKDAELKVLNEYAGVADYVFTHSDLVGARTQVNPTRPINRHVCRPEDFEPFKRVYSGHIHIRQTVGNFTFVGAPYHMDRNDIGNKKGIYVLDPVHDKDTFIPNNYSPEFVQIKVEKAEDIDVIADHTNNYVDLIIDEKLMTDKKCKMKLDWAVTKHKIESVVWVTDKQEEPAQIDVDITSTQWDMEKLAKEYVMSKKYAGEDTREDVLSVISAAFEKHRRGS